MLKKTWLAIRKDWFIFCSGLILGAIFGLFLKSWSIAGQDPATRGKIIRQGAIGFTNPILACEVGDKEVFSELRPLEDKIKQQLDQEIRSHNARNVSVYFRALNSGRWVGINEDERFAPASLLKTLIMMAYYKVAEIDPSILDTPIAYVPQAKALSELGTTSLNDKLEINKVYSIEKLIENMVTESSNPSMSLLVDYGDLRVANALHELFTDLNLTWPPPQKENDLEIMTARNYSLAFRFLYGGTFLNTAMSEKALEVLSRASFAEGLSAGVPKDVTVAHKFGARSLSESFGNLNGAFVRELHDCGIIYYPEHPYLLCVMTRGADFEKLKITLANISQSVYGFINEFYKSNNNSTGIN